MGEGEEEMCSAIIPRVIMKDAHTCYTQSECALSFKKDKQQLLAVP